MSPLSGADEANDDQWGQALFESGSASSIDDDQASKNPSSRKLQNQNHQQVEQLKCPRCSSMNTKFCYYNNYNRSQPRHFCKGCKRHWTKGGTLRNVPVGGGRKNKRLRTSAPAPAAPPTTTTKSQPEILNFPMAHLKNHHHQQQQQQQQQYPSSSWMLPLHQEQMTLPSSFSNSSHFDSIIPSSFPGSNVDEHVESSSSITAITPTDSAVFSHPWQGPNNYWNWNEVEDPFISSDLNLSWDDIEIKP